VRLRLALSVAAAVALAVFLYAGHPARADYSDHGTPDVSEVERTVNSTHPGQGLARTGGQLDDWALVAVLGVAGGAALLLASRKRTGVRT
jgi:LPXTG-motif cell wall-anchored protein